MWIDNALFQRCSERLALSAWVPESTIVVLGSSNKPEDELFEEHCREDKVMVLKRSGGGGAVVLHPGCVVVSVGAWVEDYFKNPYFFSLLNGALCDLLVEKWPALSGVAERGISDLALGEFKVAGTSLFRSRHYLLFQASLLVEARIPLLNRYLKHPTREPDYRQGRPHGEFVMGLADLEAGLTPGAVRDAVQRFGAPHFEKRLMNDLIDPHPDQIPHVLSRMNRGSL